MAPDTDPTEAAAEAAEPGTEPTADDLAGDDGLDADDDGLDGADDPFEDLVFAALDSLPEAFRERLGRVAVVIEDEPSAELLASVGAPGLYGLYQGVPRTAWGADDAMVASKITIYRGSHLRQYHDPESLARGVADTVRHEVAHHFGISDARLVELAQDHRHG
jgi:predicted Zn-dependent protease with MMP-like domain